MPKSWEDKTETISKERIIGSIVEAAETFMPRKSVEMLSLVLWRNMKDLECVSACRALSVDRLDNESILRRFLGNKMLEGCSLRTIRNYTGLLRNFCKEMKIDLLHVQGSDVQTYMARKLSKGRSSDYMRAIRATLCSFYAWAEEDGLVSDNPMKRIKKFKRAQSVKKPFTEIEMEKIREACQSVRERAMVELFLSTGCRVSEIANARLQDLHLTEGTLKVMGKGGKERVVFLNAPAQLYVSEYLSQRPIQSEGLFIGEQKPYAPLHMERFEVIFRAIGKRAGVEKVHPHRFRRTAATWANKRGMPVEQVQSMLGHSRIDTTMIYTSVQQDEVQASHEKFMDR